MKKLLLSLGLVFGGLLVANAQLPYTQNFEASMTSLPVGWSVGSATYHTGNPGWEFNNVWPSHGNNLWSGNVATHTYSAFVDDVDYDYTGGSWNNTTPVTCYDTLYSSLFSCAGHASVFISFDLNFNNYTGGGEVGTIAYSTDGGATWSTAVNLPVYSGDISWHNGQLYDLSSFIGNQANVKLAFTWNNAGAVGAGYCGWGMAVDNINAYVPISYDVACTSVSNSFLVQTGTPVTFQGTEYNWGGTTITSMHMNYSVNGGPAQSDNMLGLSISPLTSYNFVHSIAWTPAVAGNYTVKFWADNLNGANADMNNANDTLTVNYLVINTVQKRMVMFEESVGQSCYWCMEGSPNMDSVTKNCLSNCNVIHYHVPYPGPPDYMNTESAANTNPRPETYYAIGGTPDGEIDGSSLYPGGAGNPHFSSAAVQADAAIGSPFSITINSFSYHYNYGVADSSWFDYNATITSYGTFPAGIKAQVALTVDSITYAQDYSSDDPKSTFAPPIGTTVGGTADSYYQYVLKFPSVVTEMLPNANGTNLGAFTPNSTQTISGHWKKNHAFSVKAYPFDSSSTVHLTIFLQTNGGIPANSIPAKYVFQSASKQATATLLGVPEVTNNNFFEMYPNPTNGTTNLSFKLDQSQDVNIAVFNLLGEKVYSVDKGKMGAGSHLVSIDGSALDAGVYLVRFTTDNVTSVKRLEIQK